MRKYQAQSRFSTTILILVFSMGSIPAFSADALSDTQSAVQEWVRTEQLISQERRQWREERAAIENILIILAAERRELNTQISRAEDVASRADEERAALVSQLTEYEETSLALQESVGDYERQLLLLERYLPFLLQHELAPRYARIQSGSGASSLSLSERAQSVFAIMAAINNFDSQLTLTTEVLDDIQSQPIEVRVIYFGLGRAFFVNDNQTIAGFGVPGENNWQWTISNEAAPNIARAMAIFETRVSPQLVELPMELHSDLSTGAAQ